MWLRQEDGRRAYVERDVKYQERCGEEDRKPGGKTRVIDMESVGLQVEEVTEMTQSGKIQ